MGYGTPGFSRIKSSKDLWESGSFFPSSLCKNLAESKLFPISNTQENKPLRVRD